MNLARGAANLLDDWHRAACRDKPAGAENFVVGRDIAITKGDVVYRNNLIELMDHEILHSRSVAA